MNDIKEILTGNLRPYITDVRGNDYYEPEFLALEEIPATFINHYNILQYDYTSIIFQLPNFFLIFVPISVK